MRCGGADAARSWGPRAFVLAALLLAAVPAAAQRRGTVSADYFVSSALGVRKDYLIYLPPSYPTDPVRRFPVVYYLHGAFGSEDDWVQQGGLDVVMDSLIAAGMPEMIVVMPDGDDGFYTEWATSYKWRECPTRTDLREAAARYCVREPRYDAYIARDLVRNVDATYRTLADARHRGIAGLSMGGFGAMALAVEYPDLWAAAASHSGPVCRLALAVDTAARTVVYAGRPDTLRAANPTLWPLYTAVFGPDTAAWWARDPVGRIRRMRAQDRGRIPALYADIGTEDSRLVNNRAFRIELAKLGIPLDYHEYPGEHDWPYWRAHVAQSLTWLSQHFAR
ncbi:MAG: alpha/beta hydrolase family protein [Gemmatimonadales bacterium]|jgi:S-formylglutathione hydrolase FrmB